MTKIALASLPASLTLKRSIFHDQGVKGPVHSFCCLFLEMEVIKSTDVKEKGIHEYQEYGLGSPYSQQLCVGAS